METPRRHRRRHHGRRVRASRGGSGMGMAEFGIAFATGGLGFVLADGLDRFLATYDPSSTEAKPKDKFTSDGTGTLANTLNVASRPGWMRLGAGATLTAVPAFAAGYVKNPYIRASLEGAALGAGINLFKSLWNSFLMPMLIGKDVSPAALQKSFIVRLYPAEVSAKLNLDSKKDAAGKTADGPYPAAGVLSGQEAGVGGKDVGPFALQGDSPYPDAAQALRREAGVHGDSPYPDAAAALRREAGVHGDSPYPDAATALRTGVHAPAGHGNPGQPGVSDWSPGPPPGSGPGPKAEPHTDPSCGCIGDQYSTFLGEPAPESDVLFPTG